MDATETEIEAARDVGRHAISITLLTPPGFDARPGQFVKVTIDVGGEDYPRFYTISSPRVDDFFEITVGIDPEGDATPTLAALEAGDTLTVEGPFGTAYYEADSRSVVLAGGPGVGPAVGIAERALEDGHEAAVVYRDDDPMHAERLDVLRERGAFVRVLDNEEELAHAAREAIRGTDGEQVFVYGFADFLEDATGAISAAGGDPDEAKLENFG